MKSFFLLLTTAEERVKPIKFFKKDGVWYYKFGAEEKEFSQLVKLFPSSTMIMLSGVVIPFEVFNNVVSRARSVIEIIQEDELR